MRRAEALRCGWLLTRRTDSLLHVERVHMLEADLAADLR